MDFVGARDGGGTDSKAEEAIKRAEEAEKKLLAYIEKENADLLKRAEEAEKKLKKEKKKNANLKSYLQKKDDALRIGFISKYICGFDDLKNAVGDDNTVATAGTDSGRTYDTRTTYETYGTYGTYGTNDTRTAHGGFTGCCGGNEFDVITTAGTYDTSGTYETFDTRGAYDTRGERGRNKDDERDEAEKGGVLSDDDVTIVAANKNCNGEAGMRLSEAMVVPTTESMGDVKKVVSWADVPDEVSLDTEVTEEDYCKTVASF